MTEIDVHRVPADLTARLRQAAAYLRAAEATQGGSSRVSLAQVVCDCAPFDAIRTILEAMLEYSPQLGTPDWYLSRTADAVVLDFLDTRVIDTSDLEATFGPGWPGVVRVVQYLATEVTPETGRALAERHDVMWFAVDDLRSSDAHFCDLETPTTRAIAQQYADYRSGYDAPPVPPEATQLHDAYLAVRKSMTKTAIHTAESLGEWAAPDEATEPLTPAQLAMMLWAARAAVLAEMGRHRITDGQYNALAAPLVGAPAPEPAPADDELDDDDFDQDFEDDCESVQARLTFHPSYTDGWMELEVRRVSCLRETPYMYEEIEGGDVFHEVLTVPSSMDAAALEAAKAEVCERLRAHGLRLWDDDWLDEGGFAILNDTKPLA
ncbi:hypothetical protein AB0K62_13610 [Streptomyces halstedii]|uniref:hypothetical protein n=1 Tax=Streptomyces halstedii TaxID=1944 RepID=UPI00345FB609